MAYSDLSGSYFHYEDLVAWSWFDALAENDAYDRIPVGSVKTFFQAAAPTGWTQVTTQNDKALRIVSGAGGVSGGAVAISSGFTLAHSHTVASHTHSQSAHQHQLDYAVIAGTKVINEMVSTVAGSHRINVGGGSGASWGKVNSATGTDGSGDASGSATPGTDSQLSNVTLAYVDLILASKD